MSEKILTKKRRAWVNQFKPNVLKGTPLLYNAGVEEKYRADLDRLIRRMTTETKKEIERLFKTEPFKEYFAMDAQVSPQAKILTNKLKAKFSQLFSDKAGIVASSMVKNADRASKAQLHGSLMKLSGGLSLKTSAITAPMKQIIKASITENVGLIKSIPQQYFTDVQGAVMRSITTGNGLNDLVPFLDNYEGITLRRAKNIALDQSRKAYNNLNKGRMVAVGVKKYTWLHSGGGAHPRPDHVAMSGNIYSFDNPPVIDQRTGERGIPGQAINCRCTMTPIIEFESSEE